MYNKDTAPSDGEQQSRRDGANEEWGRRSGGGALYREGDSRVKGAARPIRWLQLITVCLLIVRRPQAELLRREGGEFDLITAHPKGDLGNVGGGGGLARRTPAGCAVAIFPSSFH